MQNRRDGFQTEIKEQAAGARNYFERWCEEIKRRNQKRIGKDFVGRWVWIAMAVILLAAVVSSAALVPQMPVNAQDAGVDAGTDARDGTDKVATEDASGKGGQNSSETPSEDASGKEGQNSSETPSEDVSGKEGRNSSGAETVTLRVCNWEEYLDEGDWDEEETIDLPSGDIIGVNPMIEDFEDWYYETYGIKVKVAYSTFGTNEDLYNMLTLGDVYDVVCPSEYMFMKLMAEGQLVPLSEHFFDKTDENNYYIRGVSPYIQNIFNTKEINGEAWSKYAAGYMWGITGIVYNPMAVSEEEASTWKMLADPAYKRQVTIKDNVRDTYFAAVGALKSDLLTSEEFVSDPNYLLRLEEEMNDTSTEMVAAAQEYLQGMKDNAYSFETDSGKADMITGKVVANLQWSGDAVYTMQQAEEDEYPLAFAVPKESTNIYFDGWVLLKRGVEGDPAKQQAAEAFINFTSRADNVIRNMYYVGYTSVMSGGDDPRIFEYAQWNYEAEDDEEETAEYDLGYFFEGTGDAGVGEDAAEAAVEANALEEGGAAGTVEANAAGEADTAEANAAGAADTAEANAAEAADTAEANAAEAAGTAEANTAEDGGAAGITATEFFGDRTDLVSGSGAYVITAPADQVNRELRAAYPSQEDISRASIMVYFNAEQSARINQMWINVRCFNITKVPVWGWILTAVVVAGIVALVVRRRRHWKAAGR